jgi:hypothetical protein
MRIRVNLRGRLVRKPGNQPVAEAREATGEEVRVAMATRVRKRLNDEYVAPDGWQLQSY